MIGKGDAYHVHFARKAFLDHDRGNYAEALFRERPKVVRSERHVPALRILRRTHLVNARVVDRAYDGKMRIDDLGCRAKPFDNSVLLDRVRACLKRTQDDD